MIHVRNVNVVTIFYEFNEKPIDKSRVLCDYIPKAKSRFVCINANDAEGCPYGDN